MTSDMNKGWLVEFPPREFTDSQGDCISAFPLCKRSSFFGLAWLVDKRFTKDYPKYVYMWTGLGEELIFGNTSGKIFSESWRDFGNAIGYWNSGTLRVGTTWPSEFDKDVSFRRFK